MAAKPKTRGSGTKGKAAKKSQEEQSARFIEVARMLESDETGRVFKRAFDAILKAKVGASSRQNSPKGK